ncbi:resolvase (plasmid) [Alkalihalophilus pseudofirmus OF4]|uniref:Resolvase n=7 Tax=Bacillaceae TaxID=186817 RepID=D3G1Y4_ALKPO|nr:MULTISPECIES: recombinase family protein [Bacillaceae]ADC52360.1 resolvase [Alkalihalophilus pseudofirmus OF4]ERN51507.1 resolvase [Alkalihalophilus marmarensis DSM 21297]KGA97955.1 transposon Tn917 resolvase [Alkalihalobacillus alcalophilus ATCC 27647 = CGMCC 1.3604]KHF37911.1 transposon resolvase [Halalkalibacter okhensis]MCM3715421.1 recombinase family protein [Halalkalibacter oceani]
MGKVFGYARVSTQDQILDLQIDVLEKAGAAVIYKEKITGTRKERPELEQLLKAISKGDSVVVYKLDRISRSTKHLIELVETFEEKEVNFISIQDNIDTSTAMGRFFFRTMASIAELERDIISERTKSGLQSARMRGRNGGRPSKDPKLVERALKLHSSKQYSIKEITDMTGVSKSVLYRALEKN